MKTKWQDLHDKLYMIAQSQVGNDKVFDYRQLNDIGYPFVDFNDSDLTALGTKNGGAIQKFNFILNVWSEMEDLKNLSKYAENILSQASKIKGFTLIVNESSMKYTIDRTVTPYIRRAIITLTFR